MNTNAPEREMRGNIRDIIAATKCDEAQANQIEQEINNEWLLDWSECSMSQLNKVAKQVAARLFPKA